MGRLFWKFFSFFFLAQMTSIIGVSLFFWLSAQQSAEQQANERQARELLRSGPMEIALLEAAMGALQYGGEPGLLELLRQWSQKDMPQVYAINEAGEELLQRRLPISMDDILHAGRGVVIGQGSDGKPIRLFTLDERRNGMGPGPGPRSLDDMRGERGGDRFGEPPGDRGDGPPPRGRRGDVPMGERPPGPSDAIVSLSGPSGPMFPWTPIWMGLIASLVFAALLAWYISKPINELRRGFARVAGGNFKDKVSPAMGSRRDELADLGDSFDRMTEQLDALMQGQQRLLHYVSHEIRSPLARLQMGIGLAKQNPDRLETLDRIEMESMRMDKLLGEVLELSRLESGIVALRKEKILLSELLEGVVEDARFEASAKYVEIHSHVVADAEIEAQPELLYRALENILRNAIKYSPDYGEVILETERREAWLAVMISDRGPGIPEPELDNIFKPFYRADSAGSVSGHGLGLAITKQALDLHGGKILMQNRQGGGLRVEVSLPVA